jgi:hypothetical protein
MNLFIIYLLCEDGQLILYKMQVWWSYIFKNLLSILDVVFT